MVRKANGYLTKSGQFFNTKPEAEAYEAVQGFNEALAKTLDDVGIGGLLASYTTDTVRHFVLANRDVVRQYMKLVPEIDTPEPPTRNDIRAPTPEPATGPVTDFVPLGALDIADDDEPLELIDVKEEPVVLPEIPDEPDISPNDLPPEFVQAFTDTVGADDSGAAEPGGNEEVRLDGV